MAQYYCLISGLIEYDFDSDKKSLNYEALIDEITSTITSKDRRQLEMLMEYYDVQNIILKTSERNCELSRLGTYSEKEVERIAALLTGKEKSEEDEVDEVKLKPFLKIALRAISDTEYATENNIITNKGIDNLLLSLYYQYVDKNGGNFVRRWSLLDRNIRNISAAVKARQMLKDPTLVVIGDGEIVQAITTNSSSDFGLKGELHYMDDLLAILANENIFKKERDLDMLRWSEIDEMNIFNYFNIDVVLGYYLKIAMIERWIALDPTIGREIFNKLVKELSSADLTAAMDI